MEKQVQKGSRVKRTGADFLGIERGKVYTVREVGRKYRETIKLKGVSGTFVMGLFELVEKSNIKKLSTF